ncbi:MAG TPA: UDP-N-acetylenolpyruvoylglucosamine reductase [Elusimicrobia bacterium]|nr:MAG: UDP-N-acetylenolpyruvoylglucosamine reductase [Elusimicrobia bacterium GWD2_63_28]HCC48366.1 UDP-N-acetylenolpyruvoylglucosamine reductase [Elusimicrobiota bacterium]
MPDLSALKERFGEHCVFDEPAAGFTTYRAGGRAEAVVRPGSPADLLWLAGWCRERNVPLLVLGRGSNVLVSDRGLPGVIALTWRLSKIEISGSAIEAQAGAQWDDIARLSAERGLAGLEKTSGIPGSVGGAVRMNAGAFGQETFDRLASVEAFDASGAAVKLLKKDIAHGYRRAEGLDGLTILSARFEFEPGDPAVLIQDRSCVLASREAKQPLDYPSAGSVFKRPPGDYASRLIDAAGLKGHRVGGAMVSDRHAGFIINSGGATAADIYALILEVRARVKEQSGVELQLEQILLGEF